MESPDKARDGRQAIRRALTILEAFLDLPDPYVGLGDLARRAQLSPSTTHRLVSAMVDAELLMQDPQSGRYGLGPKCIQLGRKALGGIGLEVRALPAMQALAWQVQGSVNLGILSGDGALYIQKVESPQALRLNLPVGTKIPLHCTAIGKILLAGMDPEAMQRFLDNVPLSALQPHTMTDPSALAAHIGQVKRQGYATDDEEFLRGVNCLGVPIAIHGQVVAALAVQSPKILADITALQEHLPEILAASRAIERQLGATE